MPLMLLVVGSSGRKAGFEPSPCRSEHRERMAKPSPAEASTASAGRWAIGAVPVHNIGTMHIARRTYLCFGGSRARIIKYDQV